MAVNQESRPRSARPPGEGDGSAERQLLQMIAQVAARQRTAIIERDLPSLNRLFEALVQLQGEWTAVLEERAARGEASPDAAVAALAGQIRQQLGINRVLLANGIAMVDHFISCVGEASAIAASPSQNAGATASNGASAALFSGVA